jgi:hypothetical protein
VLSLELPMAATHSSRLTFILPPDHRIIIFMLQGAAVEN